MRTALSFTLISALACTNFACAGRSGSGGTSDRGPELMAVASVDPQIDAAWSPGSLAGATWVKPVDPKTLTATELQFGRSPRHDPSVTYQPGVILMEHGDTALTSMEANGLVWHFNAGAPQVDQIAVGSILYATDRCVGRVLAVSTSGDDVKVVLGPVEMTDILQKAHIAYDEPLDLASVVAVPAPAFPAERTSDQAPLPSESRSPSAAPSDLSSGAPSASPTASATSTATGGESPIASPTATATDVASPSATETSMRPGRRLISMEYAMVTTSGQWKPFRHVDYDAHGRPHLRRARRDAGAPFVVAQAGGVAGAAAGVASMAAGYASSKAPPVTLGDPPTVDLPDGYLQSVPCLIGCGGLGVKLAYDDYGIKVKATAVLHFSSAPRVRFHVAIDATGIKTATVGIEGVGGFRTHIDMAADKKFVRNIHETGIAPIDISIPINFAAAMSIHVSQSLLLETAFSAKTSTLSATYDIQVCCRVEAGYTGTWGVTTPTVSAVSDPAQDVVGLSVGINSAVFAMRQQVLVGMGFLGLATGPYVALTTSVTALKQSSIAMVDCRQATVDMSISAGVGWTIPKIVAKVINFFLSVLNVKPIRSSGSFIESGARPIFNKAFVFGPPHCSGSP